MSLNSITENMVERIFGVCSGPDQWPHAVHVEVATDHVGTPGKDGGTITLRNVIAAWEVAATVAEGFSIRRGCYGTPPHRGEEASKWCAHETNVAEC